MSNNQGDALKTSLSFSVARAMLLTNGNTFHPSLAFVLLGCFFPPASSSLFAVNALALSNSRRQLPSCDRDRVVSFSSLRPGDDRLSSNGPTRIYSLDPQVNKGLLAL